MTRRDPRPGAGGHRERGGMRDGTRNIIRPFHTGAITCPSCHVRFYPTASCSGPLCYQCKGLSQIKDAIDFYRLSVPEGEE